MNNEIENTGELCRWDRTIDNKIQDIRARKKEIRII